MESVINVKINENDEIEYVNIEETEEVYETDDDGADTTVLVPNGDGVMTIRRKNKTVVEHVCGKCEKIYKSLPALKRHLNLCRHQPIPTAKLKAVKLEKMPVRNLKCTSLDGGVKENECFCCFEDKITAHIGCIACNFCPKSFKSHIQLERHLFTLHSPCTLFACHICNATCPSPEILELHVASHDEGKPFSCTKCGKEFTRKYHLDRHLEFTGCDESREKKMLPCKVCHKEFTRLDNLREHLRVHLGHPSRRKDYECPFCEKSFYGSSLLNIHIRTHTGERPFPCDLCNDTFPSNGALRKHRRRHTGEKPYNCSVCPKAFSVKETLNRHMKIHTGNRPHVCTECGVAFIQATQLRNHMARHASEQYPCQECDAKFHTPQRLHKHMIKNHFEQSSKEKYRCDVCQATFRLKARLALHLRKHIRKAAFEQNKIDKAAESDGETPRRVTRKRELATEDPGHAGQLDTPEIKIETELNDYLEPVAKKPRGRPRKVRNPEEAPLEAVQQIAASEPAVADEVGEVVQHIDVPLLEEADETGGLQPIEEEEPDSAALGDEENETAALESVDQECEPDALAEQQADQEKELQDLLPQAKLPGDGPFQCDQCPRNFALKRYLHVHQKAHSRRPERPFRCKVCKCDFKSLTYLTSHMRQCHFHIFMNMMMDTSVESSSSPPPATPNVSTPSPNSTPKSASAPSPSSTIRVIHSVSSVSKNYKLPDIKSLSFSSSQSPLPMIRGTQKPDSPFSDAQNSPPHSSSEMTPLPVIQSVFSSSAKSIQTPAAKLPHSTKPKLLNRVPPTTTVSPPSKSTTATPTTKPSTAAKKSITPKNSTVSLSKPLTVTIKSESGPENSADEYEIEIIHMKEEQDDDGFNEPPSTATAAAIPDNQFDIPISLSASELTDNIAQLLTLLVDEQTLTELGWPEASCEDVLAEVIAQCGQSPADRVTCPDYETVMRENAKLLFTSVINNDSIKSLLNNNTVDEVIMHVLKLAS